MWLIKCNKHSFNLEWIWTQCFSVYFEVDFVGAMENMKSVLEHLSLTTSVLTCFSEGPLYSGEEGEMFETQLRPMLPIYINTYINQRTKHLTNTGKQTWQSVCGSGKKPILYIEAMTWGYTIRIRWLVAVKNEDGNIGNWLSIYWSRLLLIS